VGGNGEIAQKARESARIPRAGEALIPPGSEEVFAAATFSGVGATIANL
jgi:hypothetical protein